MLLIMILISRLGDFWVLDTGKVLFLLSCGVSFLNLMFNLFKYLDIFITDIWQWSELTSFGDLPSSRDFSAASAIGNRKIVMYVVLDFQSCRSFVCVRIVFKQ